MALCIAAVKRINRVVFGYHARPRSNIISTTAEERTYERERESNNDKKFNENKLPYIGCLVAVDVVVPICVCECACHIDEVFILTLLLLRFSWCVCLFVVIFVLIYGVNLASAAAAALSNP